jgi:threonyl-tRNA synthetase
MAKKSIPIEYIRHSLAHVLAMAVLERWPDAKLGVGPVIATGCYYDFELPEAIGPQDLPDLEKRMRKIIQKNLDFSGRQVSFDEAREFFKKKNQPYKLQLIDDLEMYGTTEPHEKLEIRNSKLGKLKTVGLYQTGDFVDLCRGGHVKNTRELNPEAFRVIKIAGAYWRGSETNPMLTRIYVAAFRTKKELDKYLAQQEEAFRRDHRRLGEALDLFTFSPLVGPGLPLYTPKGTIIRKLVQEYVNELQKKEGYEEVWTPQIAKAELFKTSGHYEKFKGDMFRVVSNYSDEEMFLKPMNCPGHTQIYASKPRSWRDLPIRYADFAMLYRDEKPGELLGLARVRAFSQDDAHIFCREDQIEEEFDRALRLIQKVLKTYNLKYWVRLSLRDPRHPEKYLGEKSVWDKAEKMLAKILKKKRIKYKAVKGEAAFYGPKMDVMVEDSLGREWQISTIQLDFQMPSRFGLTYTDKDGTKKTPVMIHRAINGSAERFLALLIEHYAGAFPLWLAPVQVAVIPVSDKFNSYGKKVSQKLIETGIRVELWDQNESVGKKIREGELQKIPYLLVVGEKERKQNAVSVRERGKGDTGSRKLDKFIASVIERISSRNRELIIVACRAHARLAP